MNHYFWISSQLRSFGQTGYKEYFERDKMHQKTNAITTLCYGKQRTIFIVNSHQS